MWFVAGSGMLQMWAGAHLITFTIGFMLSFGLAVIQAEHIPEVIFRSSQLGSKALYLIPMSTGFRAVTDLMMPSGHLSVIGRQFDYAEVFAIATSSAIVLILLFTIINWLAERSVNAGWGL